MKDVAEMTPDELRVAVLEEVLGWRWHEFEVAHSGGEVVKRILSPTAPEIKWLKSPQDDTPLAHGWDWDLPDYPRDIAAAFTLVDKLRNDTEGDEYIHYLTLVCSSHNPEQWAACFNMEDIDYGIGNEWWEVPTGNLGSNARCDNPAEAICRSAVLAVRLRVARESA